MGARYNLQATATNTASQGELYWGRGGHRRLSYVLDLSDLSRRSSASYEGKVKVGALSRAVQLSGAVSRSPLSRQMDATLQWDADRDQNQQVALKTRWSSGETNQADVTLSLPSINQVSQGGSGCCLSLSAVDARVASCLMQTPRVPVLPIALKVLKFNKCSPRRSNNKYK